jgi:hypothetical protein
MTSVPSNSASRDSRFTNTTQDIFGYIMVMKYDDVQDFLAFADGLPVAIVRADNREHGLTPQGISVVVDKKVKRRRLLASAGSITVEITADAYQKLTKKQVVSIRTEANANLLAEAKANGARVSIDNITPVEV